MPIYEYECKKCGRRFEFLQRFGDEPKTVCTCGEGGELKRVISAPAIQFKGNGWYVTDYAGKSGRPADHSDRSAKKEEKGGTDKGTEADE
jgi:putative FmdB family regulatory protein